MPYSTSHVSLPHVFIQTRHVTPKVVKVSWNKINIGTRCTGLIV